MKIDLTRGHIPVAGDPVCWVAAEIRQSRLAPQPFAPTESQSTQIWTHRAATQP